MNAGFCNSKCRLMQFLCVILFVCVVVALKEASHDYGFFMQIGRQAAPKGSYHKARRMPSVTRKSSSFLRQWVCLHSSS